MSLPKLKTTVVVTDLIKAIERVRDEELKKTRAELAAYKTKRAAFEKELRAHLREKVAEIEADFVLPKRGKNGARIHDVGDWLGDGLPSEPAVPNDEACVRGKYDTLIAQLKISAESRIKLSPEDFGRFMAGDASACRC